MPVSPNCYRKAPKKYNKLKLYDSALETEKCAPTAPVQADRRVVCLKIQPKMTKKMSNAQVASHDVAFACFCNRKKQTKCPKGSAFGRGEGSKICQALLSCDLRKKMWMPGHPN